jgi:hypothetical protein
MDDVVGVKAALILGKRVEKKGLKQRRKCDAVSGCRPRLQEQTNKPNLRILFIIDRPSCPLRRTATRQPSQMSSQSFRVFPSSSEMVIIDCISDLIYIINCEFAEG